MPNNLQDTWNDIATKWSHWGPPLRPCLEDIQIMESALATWKTDGYADSVDGYAEAVLLGVTPEIANMNFPLPTDLLAIDKASGMISHVWTGDTDHKHAVQGDWLTYNISPHTKDIVLADGSLVFFSPYKLEQLAIKVSEILKKDGIFVVRAFTMPSKKETITTVLADVRDGYIPNFHEFKFRLAMALQHNFATGISQDEIWRAMQVVVKSTPHNGYSVNDLATGDVYRGKSAKHYFPTPEELRAILEERFTSVKIVFPTSYDFGPCCPTFIVQGPR